MIWYGILLFLSSKEFLIFIIVFLRPVGYLEVNLFLGHWDFLVVFLLLISVLITLLSENTLCFIPLNMIFALLPGS